MSFYLPIFGNRQQSNARTGEKKQFGNEQPKSNLIRWLIRKNQRKTTLWP